MIARVLSIFSMMLMPFHQVRAADQRYSQTANLAALINSIQSPQDLVDILRASGDKEKGDSTETFFKSRGFDMKQKFPSVFPEGNSIFINGQKLPLVVVRTVPLTISYGKNTWVYNSESSFATNLDNLEKALFSPAKKNALMETLLPTAEAQGLLIGLGVAVGVAAIYGGTTAALTVAGVSLAAIGVLGVGGLWLVACGFAGHCTPKQFFGQMYKELFGSRNANAAASMPLKPIECSSPDERGNRTLSLEIKPNVKFSLHSSGNNVAGFTLDDNGKGESYSLKKDPRGKWQLLDASGKAATTNLDQAEIRTMVANLAGMGNICSDPKRVSQLNQEIADFNKATLAQPKTPAANSPASTVN